MIKGVPVADGLAILEIFNISFLAGSANPKMRARLAFIKSSNGATLGYADHENWSTETLQALATLRSAMELDVAKLYLTGYDTAGGGARKVEPQGIASYLGNPEAPSI